MRTRRTNPKEPVDTYVLPERDLKKANELREKINKNHAWFPGLQTFKLKRKDEYLLVDLSSGNGYAQALGRILFDCCSAVGLHSTKRGPQWGLAYSACSLTFLEGCYPVSWKKVPPGWQMAFLERLAPITKE